MNTIKTTAIAFATVATIAVMSASPAEAGKKHRFAKGLVAGAIVGAVIAGSSRRGHGHSHAPAPRYSAWDAHVDWCYDNRPRYRERNNTFKYRGAPRQTCYSPYN